MAQKHVARKLAEQRQTAIRDMLIQNQTLRRDNTALVRQVERLRAEIKRLTKEVVA